MKKSSDSRSCSEMADDTYNLTLHDVIAVIHERAGK